MSFEKLNIIEPILQALKTEGYTKPTPIQEQAIPILLEGKDLLGCAQTGTGKTAAFAIPIIQLLHQKEGIEKGRKTIKALIITPTRELAIQIGESFQAYGKNTKLNYTVIFGGVNQRSQTDALRAGVDVVIATPGRLLDLMNQKFISLKSLEFFVLDEADRMLDMGFVHDVKKIIAVLPANRQSLFFSATMPPVIVTLANTILKNPAKVEVTPVSSTADTIKQSVFFVSKPDKLSLLLHVLKDKSINTALVFTRTKHGADKVSKYLIKANIKSEAIHGNKSQNARQNALKNFKNKTTRVLVATDIAARGIDVDELTHVINFEIPEVPETYVHRIGRTGRAGANGIAFSFCDAEEMPDLRGIQKLIAKTIPIVEEHPFVMSVDLTSEPSKKNKEQSKQKNKNNNSRRPNSNERNSADARPEKKQFVRSDSNPTNRNTANTVQGKTENSNTETKPKKKWFGKPRNANS